MPKYAILTCPVCWEEVEFSDDKPTYTFEEYIVFFCGNECFEQFQTNADYYTALLKSALNNGGGCGCGGNCGCGGH